MMNGYIHRRGMLTAGLVSAGALAFPGIVLARAGAPAIVKISEGSVRGVEGDGVVKFLGLRYGASTAGANRFMPPRPPEKFSGVFEANTLGDQAPQMRTFLTTDAPISEDCLRINIWTPATDNRRRPVMLWLHGGGFEAGTGGSALYEGSNLARRGDVVVATINHRLNVFGHCHLAARLGADYASSGNVGFLDLLAAMKWVRKNISAFGGDPGNVTIFGQSGGGRKVSLSYASPEAKGLFARGIVQSGSHLLVQSPEQADQLVGLLLKALSLAEGDAAKLKSVPMDQLIAAQSGAIKEAGYRFEPVLDGKVFPQQPWLPNPPQWSSNLPMMLGSTRTELSATLGLAKPELFGLTEKALPFALAPFVGKDKVEAAIAAFRVAKPDAPAPELFFTIASARAYGRDATLMSEQRAQPATAPTWLYKLAWRSPAQGGRRVSPHSLDLPFIFDNVPAGVDLAGPPSADTAEMVNMMAGTWLAFARNGNPNNPAVPDWAPYDIARRTTMIFDQPATAVSDPWPQERVFMEGYETTQLTEGRYRGLGG